MNDDSFGHLKDGCRGIVKPSLVHRPLWAKGTIKSWYRHFSIGDRTGRDMHK